ncbi:MAG: hypothetical protein PHV39_07225 [Methanomicrobium sp.]|nr:hypothetical protein [Methanomicrobium sp.]
MNSRIYDILSLLGAVLIVVIIAFVMKPGMFYGTSEEQAGVTYVQTPQYADYSESVAADLLSDSYDAGIPTRDEEMWILASRISGAMDYYEPATRDFAVRYIPKDHSGEFTISQACDIWDGVKSDWTYEYDPYGIWDLSPASRTINTGLDGDQNDFAIFTASLLKSIGGQARIKLAQSPQAGEHTYAELYLGNSDDFNTKMINSTALEEFKSTYPGAFVNDPYGVNIFKYEFVEQNGIDGKDGVISSYPLSSILTDPEKYTLICYEYPKLIEYLLVLPDTNVIDFQIMYLKFRYGGYTNPYVPYYSDVSTLRDISYSSEFEKNGDKTYWLKIDWFDRYPGDNYYVDSNSATVFYSDSSWDDIRFNSLYD